MAYEALIYEIVIASPSDLKNERKTVKEAVLNWNATQSKYYKIIFQPVMWETDTIPEVNIRPQESINEQIIRGSDMLIAMFWSKFGTPTGESPSGTVEEINLFIDADKPVALYFSEKSTPISNIDAAQLESLRAYKQSISNNAYYNVFKSTADLKQLISRFLTKTVQKLSHLKDRHVQVNATQSDEPVVIPLNNRKFQELFDQASRSNANGYWLSVVADFGDGYLQFESEQKQHVVNWATQLLQTIFPQSPVNKQYGVDHVIVTYPVNNKMPLLFRVHYSNEGVVLIQWRGDNSFIPLDWVITLCLVSVVQTVNSPIIEGKELRRLGIALSNAPEQGINTNSVFPSSSTDVYLMSRNSVWESPINAEVDIDSVVKEFVRRTLSSWGYYDFENSLDKLIVKMVKHEFLLQQRGYSSFLW